MRRALATLLLVASVAEAQVTMTFGELQKSVGSRQWSDGTRFEYDKLRQGSEEYAEVILYTPQPLYLGSSDAKDSRLIPTRFEIEPAEGFRISAFRYPASREERFSFDSRPYKILEGSGNDLRLRFKVRSSPSLPVGRYVLKGKLRFQSVSDSGISEPAERFVDIPVEVVERHAKVEYSDRSIAGIRGVKPGEWAGIVLLAPVWVPVGFFMMLTGWDGC